MIGFVRALAGPVDAGASRPPRRRRSRRASSEFACADGECDHAPTDSSSRSGHGCPSCSPRCRARGSCRRGRRSSISRRPPGDRRFLPGAMPGWADFNGGDMFYGFPDLESRGVKFAHDQHGIEVDPDTQIARADARLRWPRSSPSATAASRCSGARQLTGREVCQYENSSNGDFLIDFHPRLKNVLLVGGGSGHGFKHGPEVGRYAAARLFGLGQGGAAVQPRQQERGPPPRSALIGLLRHPDQRRPEQPVLEHVAGLHFLDDRAGLGLGRSGFPSSPGGGAGRAARRSTAMRVMPLRGERRFELARGRLDPGEELARDLVARAVPR